MMKTKPISLIAVSLALALWAQCGLPSSRVAIVEASYNEGLGIGPWDKLRPLAADERGKRTVSIIELNNFFAKHAVTPFVTGDTSVCSPTPVTILLRISREVEEVLGRSLYGAEGLDIGTGKDLRVSLVMASMFGMQMTAVEKDSFVSMQGGVTLAAAQSEGLATATNPKFLPETSVEGIPWGEFDVVMFFYTQPRDGKDAQEFRQMLERKAAEMKPGSTLAFWFTPAQVMFSWRDLFPNLSNVYDEPLRISDLERDVCLMIYRPPRQPAPDRVTPLREHNLTLSSI
jgi:hypothetical protein